MSNYGKGKSLGIHDSSSPCLLFIHDIGHVLVHNILWKKRRKGYFHPSHCLISIEQDQFCVKSYEPSNPLKRYIQNGFQTYSSKHSLLKYNLKKNCAAMLINENSLIVSLTISLLLWQCLVPTGCESYKKLQFASPIYFF